MRMMGLDIGDKRIGVALCDPLGILASAHSVIEREDGPEDINAIIKLVKEHEIGKIIVGLPRLLDGGLGTQAHKAIDFAGELLLWKSRSSSLTRAMGKNSIVFR